MINRFPSSPVEVYKQLESRLKFNEKKEYNFLSGMKAIQYKSIESSSASSSSLVFSYKPPSNVAIGRKMFIRYNLTINFTGTNSLGNNLLNIGRSSGLRAWPLTTCSNGITLKINGESITNNQPDQWWQACQRYQDWGLDQSADNSVFPSYLDQSQQYEDVTTLGFARNPLARQLENSFGMPRGATCFYTVISNTPTTAQVKCDVCEPVAINPLLWGSRDGPALVSIQDLQLQYTFDNGLQRIWSNSTIDGTTLTNVSVGISTSGIPTADASPFLLFQEMTTGFDNPVIFDKEYLYPYTSPNVQISDTFSGVTAGTTVQNSVPNIQYGVVPKSILIFVKEKLADQLTYPKTWNSTDTFARINSLSIQINGSSSILAEANRFDLYNICAKNGLKDSYCGFSADVGSVLVLELGSDIPLLDESLAPGVITNFNVQISNLNITNTSNATKNYQVVVCAMLEGLMAVKNNTCNLSTGLLSREQVLNAPLTTRTHAHTAYSLSGGGFFDRLKSGFQSAVDFGRKAYDVARQVSPVVKAVFPQTAMPLSAIGLGRRKVKKMGRGILKSDGTGVYSAFDLKKKLAQSDNDEDSEDDSEEEY
jgi:hypothetical protein